MQINIDTLLPPGFVYLNEAVCDIRVDLRYYGKNNFLGRKVDGYGNNSCIILTEKAAKALQQAQAIFSKDGFDIVVYDAYRPQRAVDDFAAWAKDGSDQLIKPIFYPRIDKSSLFKVGYLAAESSHSRGSTVDISIISKAKKLHSPIYITRELTDAFNITYVDDGTIDMGSSFDLFDEASHLMTNLVSNECIARRDYMKEVMQLCGFTPYHAEWWHFTLKDEPFPNTYFNFPIA